VYFQQVRVAMKLLRNREWKLHTTNWGGNLL